MAKGVIAARSKDSPASPSDEPGGLLTKKSGTSMSGPEVAGVALLVKQAAVKAAKGNAAAEAFLKDNLPFAVKAILMASAEDMRIPVQRQGSGLMDAEAAVRMAEQSFRKSAGGKQAWDWIVRARAAVDAPKAAYEKAAAAQTAATAAAAEAGTESRSAVDKARFAAFREGREAARERLLAGLQDENWLVRFYSAFAFIGLKDPAAAEALGKAAVTDADARVRQLALQALAEIPVQKSMDAAKAALADLRGEVRAYAAVVLARRAEPEGLKALLELAGDADRRVRFTAAWALGRAKGAGNAGAERLAAVARDANERPTNRHTAIASLRRMAAADPAAISPKAIEDLLAGSGVEDLIVTMTSFAFFSDAAGNSTLRALLASEPAKAHLVAYVKKYAAYVGKPGPVGKLVQLLARITGTQLPRQDANDPSGQGVPGVDGNLGPVHMIVELPEGRAPPRTVFASKPAVAGEAGPDEAGRGLLESALEQVSFPLTTVNEFGGTVRAVLKEGFVTLEVPGYGADALASTLGAKGFLSTRAGPQFLFLKDTGPADGLPEVHKSAATGKGTVAIIVDEGMEVTHDAFKDKVLGSLSTIGGDVTDESYGHGTHVGNITAGQQRPDGNPNVGRAPDALLIAAQVLGRRGGSMATVLEGVSGSVQILDDANAKLAAYWTAKDAGQEPALPENPALRRAIEGGVRRLSAVMNLSLGGPGKKDNPLNLALRKLMLANKAKVSVAAGNDGPGKGTANRTSPANEWSVPAIASTDKAGAPNDYSSEGNDGEPVIRRAHKGGSVLEGQSCPFLPGGIVSALAAKAAAFAARCIVPHQGKPTDQAMSGTSMAAPHNAGDDALVLEVLRSGFTPEEIEKAPGLYLWIDAHADKHSAPIEGAAAWKVGAGLRRIQPELAALKERLARDKAGILAEAAELHKKAVERDAKEAALRWSPVALQAPSVRRPLWAAVLAALARPWQATLERLARRTSTGVAPEEGPAPPGFEAARDWARLKQVRGLLSSGAPSAGGRVNPFVFHTREGIVDAEDAGLEGFLWTKKALEARLGPDAVLHHLQDSFRYAGAVLSAHDETRGMAAELRALEALELPAAEKNTRLNGLIERSIETLRAEEASLDGASWVHSARISELTTPRSYDLAGRRRAGPLAARLVQQAFELLERAGLRKPRRFFADFGYVDLWLIKRMGHDTVWTMGIHPIGVVGRGGTGGGSPYSIRDHRLVDPGLGTMAEYRAFVKRAHRMGLRVLADLVPNHTSMDSALLEEHPDWFFTRPRAEGEAKPSEHWFPYEHKPTGRKLWVHHGGYDSWGKLDTWKDTAQVDYSNESARRGMARVAVDFARETGVDGYRVDMVYQLLNDTFAKNWGRAMPKREWVEELAFELKASRRDFALIAEAYYGHEALSAAGVDVSYNKSDSGRSGERGWLNALEKGEQAALERAVDREAFLLWRRGGASPLPMASNHDEPSPRRAFGPRAKAALVLSLFLPGAHLVYVPQEVGFDRPVKDEPKQAPFSVPIVVEYRGPAVDAEMAGLHAEALPLSARLRRGIKEPEVTRLSGPGWVGYAVTPKAGTPGKNGYMVLANNTGAELAVSVERPDLGITRKETLAAHDAVVVSFIARKAVSGSLRERLARHFVPAAKWMSSGAFFVFAPMMFDTIKRNWQYYAEGDIQKLSAVSFAMMALGIVGNTLNFPVFLLSRNPWLIAGSLIGIATTWAALLPLFLSGVMPAWLFVGLAIASTGVILTAFGLRTRKSHRK